MNGEHDYEDGEGEGGVLVAPATAATNITVASEIDKQISTAKKYPRSIKKFRHKATELVTYSEAVAGACIYSLPRGGKQLVGPSVRFAEMVASAYGNLRCGARVVDEGDAFITSQGVCHDLESNLAITFEVQRRITTSKGQRFNDDMIGVTGNAANSIALRNAILRCIPKALWAEVYDAARKTAVGDAKTLTARRQGLLEKFGALGVTKEQVFGLLDKPGIDDITIDDLERMIGVFNAIREDPKRLDEFFSPPAGEAKQKATDALRSSAPKPKLDAPPPAATPQEPVDWFARIKEAKDEGDLVKILEDSLKAGLEETLRDDVHDALDVRRNEMKDGSKAKKK